METSQNVNVNIRMNAEIKKEFESFCEDMGMSMTTAINIFIRKVIRENRIPFEIGGSVPNRETFVSFAEAEAMRKNPSAYQTYGSFDELSKDLK